MTPDRLRDVLIEAGWSLRQLAEMLNVNHKTCLRWARGAYAVPPDVAEWLERVSAFYGQNPPPRR